MIKRGDDYVMPEGNALLREGDQMLIIVSDTQSDS